MGCGFGALPTRIAMAAIYGVDDRKDLSQLPDPILARAVENVAVALIPDSRLIPSEPDAFALRAEPAGTAFGLCGGQAFESEPAAATCTGILLTASIVATASHCVRDAEACGHLRFVRGFVRRGDAPSRFPATDVYGCRALLYRVGADRPDGDLALIQLDRAVTGATPPAFNCTTLQTQQPIRACGAFLGTPIKCDDQARVDTVEEDAQSYRARADTFVGASGGPVFDEHHRLAGMIRGGRADLERSGLCNVVRTLPNAAPGREHILASRALSEALCRQTGQRCAECHGAAEDGRTKTRSAVALLLLGGLLVGGWYLGRRRRELRSSSGRGGAAIRRP